METFDVNGKCCISFDPDDGAFAQRIFDAFPELDRLFTGYKKQAGKLTKTQYYTLTKETADTMCEMINQAVGAPICNKILDNTIMLLFPAAGTPIWYNVLFGIVEKISVPRSRACQRVIRKYQKYRTSEVRSIEK